MLGTPGTPGMARMSIGFYAQLTPEERDSLQPLLTPRHVLRGGALFRQGDRPEGLFLIHSGCVKLIQSSSHGRDVIMELLFAGDFCGALCTAECTPYSLSAICLEDVEAGFVPRQRFQETALRMPGLLLKATSVCREKMKLQREMAVGLAVESADQRAARALLTLAARLGELQTRGVRLRMPLDRQGFAELIGTTTETAIRIFSRFRRKGFLVEAEDGYLVLPDLKALQTLTQIDGMDWLEQYHSAHVGAH